jgi:hypothetical protein
MSGPLAMLPGELVDQIMVPSLGLPPLAGGHDAQDNGSVFRDRLDCSRHVAIVARQRGLRTRPGSAGVDCGGMRRTAARLAARSAARSEFPTPASRLLSRDKCGR